MEYYKIKQGKWKILLNIVTGQALSQPSWWAKEIRHKGTHTTWFRCIWDSKARSLSIYGIIRILTFGKEKSTGLEGHRYSHDTGMFYILILVALCLYLDLGIIMIVHSVCIFMLLIDSFVFAVVARIPISQWLVTMKVFMFLASIIWELQSTGFI